MKLKVIGLDLAKHVFHVVHEDDKRKTLKRSELLRYFATLPRSLVAMEACGSAHYWGRELKGLGHEVKLYPPQHVKGYLRGQKNDYNDARAILEAAVHGRVRAVEVKTAEQQDLQVLIRARQQVIGERTAIAHQMRGWLYEMGIVVPQSLAKLRQRVPELLEEADNGLTVKLRHILARQYQRLVRADEEVAFYDQQIKQHVADDEACQRLQEIPGFGPVVSYVFRSWAGDGTQFSRGRDAAAALGVVPRQHSSGGKQVLGGITKRGDGYVRGVLIHGARAVAMRAAGKEDALSRWVSRLIAQRGFNKAVVALANKLARIAWVVLARGERYQLAQAHG